jgi:hypothetical protein
MVWVAEQLARGQSLVHNDRYYWPVGDAPWLAGNGSDGFLYLPWHILLGWPRAAAAHTLTILVLDGLGAFALARAAGASPIASLMAASAGATMVYGSFELGAGRFSQADFGFLAFFLASWLRFLDAPSVRRAFAAAALLSVTSLLYWYYGFFGVLAGGLLLVVRVGAALARGQRPDAPGPWTLAVFAGAFLVLVGPLLAVFARHYADIVGTAEDALFPHPEVTGDSCWPAVPFLVGGGRHAGRALAFSTTCFAVVAPVVRRDRGVVSLLVLAAAFFALMAGPLWPHGPYEILYGLAGPLRRFWWPYRHVVVANLAIIALASVAATPLLQRLGRWGTAAGLALALSIPAQLEVARAPFHALFSKARVPAPFYREVATLPGEVLIEPPLSQAVAATQAPLIYQFDHQKTLLNGHAMWVARVRPPAWDAFVAENSFLAAMQALERGELSGEFRFTAADLRSLIDRGVGAVTLNREYFPVRLDALLDAYDAVFRGLFGEPVVKRDGAAAWSLAHWTNQESASFRAFSWPADLGSGGPTLPVQAARPASMSFSMPAPTRGEGRAVK